MIRRDDNFCWQGTKHDEYKVSSACHMIRSFENSAPESSDRRLGSDDRVWWKEWQSNIPPKSRLFLWRALHNILPVMKNL